jgi:hypothetical protein
VVATNDRTVQIGSSAAPLIINEVFHEGGSSQIDLVIAAAAIAFGYARLTPVAGTDHPVARYLIQHVLAAEGDNPGDIMMPISVVLLDRSSDFAPRLARGAQVSGYPQLRRHAAHGAYLFQRPAGGSRDFTGHQALR